ncbi:hypothetical protein EMCRGX_G008971 [Ephydatia muelleri]
MAAVPRPPETKLAEDDIIAMGIVDCEGAGQLQDSHSLAHSFIGMLRELALLLAALLAVSAAARLKVDEPMGSSLDDIMELQADGEKSDDSEELQAHDANKDVSINDEDEQLREALYAMLATYLQQENKATYYEQSSDISSTSKSPYVGVMRAYLARKYLSSSSVMTQEELHMAGFSCKICVKAVNWAVPKITKWGCGFFFGTSATAFCNVIGFGPQDPLTWACTGVLIGSCSVILQQIRNKVASSNVICQKLKAC